MDTITAPDSNGPHGYKSWSRKKKIGAWTGGTFLGLAVIGGVSNAVSPPKPAPVAQVTQAAAPAPAPVKTVKVAAKPAPVVTHTVTAAPKPAVTVTHTAAPVAAPAPAAAAAAPAAPATDQILARFNGTGISDTGSFTVPADGNWHLSWAYTNGSTFAGQAENFQVYEYDASTGQLVDVLVNALAVGNGTPTATPVYDQAEAGQTVYFKVNTEDAGWSLVPVAGAS